MSSALWANSRAVCCRPDRRSGSGCCALRSECGMLQRWLDIACRNSLRPIDASRQCKSRYSPCVHELRTHVLGSCIEWGWGQGSSRFASKRLRYLRMAAVEGAVRHCGGRQEADSARRAWHRHHDGFRMRRVSCAKQRIAGAAPNLRDACLAWPCLVIPHPGEAQGKGCGGGRSSSG